MTTRLEMTAALSYAAIAFQRELTDELVAVYQDQLGNYSSTVIAQAVRRAVARCESFPTVRDIREDIREVRDRSRDPVVAGNMLIARRVDEARRLGKSPDEVDSLIVELEGKLNLNRLGSESESSRRIAK